MLLNSAKDSPRSFSHYRNFTLRFLVVSLFVVGLVISLFLSIYKLFYNSQYITIIALSLVFAFFLGWFFILLVSFMLRFSEIESFVFMKSFNLLFLMSFLTTYLAIIIESKAYFLSSSIKTVVEFFLASENVTHLIILLLYTLLVPLIEEITKMLPILVMLVSTIRMKNQDYRYVPSIPSLKTFIVFGGLVGGMFDLIEQLFIFSSTEPDLLFNNLIFTRTIFPLHMVTSMAASFGVGLIFYLKDKNRKSRFKKQRKYSKVVILIPFILSFVFHSYWNYLSITEQFDIRNILGYLSYVFYLSFISFLLFHCTKHCNLCFREHRGDYCSYSIKPDIKEIELEKFKKSNFRRDTEFLPCPKCMLEQYTGEFCLHCWSFPKLECNNCHQLLPAFTKKCWSCGVDVESIYDKLTSNPPSPITTLSIGIMRLFTGLTTVLFIMSFHSFSNELSSIGYTLFFLLVLGAFLTLSLWSFSKKHRIKAIIASITLTSALLLMLIFYSLSYLPFILLMLYAGKNIVLALLLLACTSLINIVTALYFKKIKTQVNLII